MPLILAVMLGLAAYRVSRLLILDTLLDRPRDGLAVWLGEHPSRLALGVLYLMSCVYCVTVWVAAAVVAATDAFVSVPLPFLQWPAAATISLVIWRHVDGADEPGPPRDTSIAYADAYTAASPDDDSQGLGETELFGE